MGLRCEKPAANSLNFGTVSFLRNVSKKWKERKKERKKEGRKERKVRSDDFSWIYKTSAGLKTPKKGHHAFFSL